MTTTTTDLGPIRPSSPLAALLREADIDPRILQPTQPFRVGPAVLSVSEEIAAAVERNREAVAKHRSAISAVRAAAQAAIEARAKYEDDLAQAAVAGEPEPKPLDISEHLARARHEASRVRGLKAATEATRRNVDSLLRDGAEVLEAVRDKAAGWADEALRHYDDMQAALGTLAGVKAESEWLDDLIFTAQHKVGSYRDWQGRIREATIADAREAVGQ